MSTYDAMDGLKRSIENLEGLAPSSTGTPVFPAAAYNQRNASHGENAGGVDHSQYVPPARKLTSKQYTSSGSFYWRSDEEKRQEKHLWIAIGVCLIGLAVLAVFGPWSS